MAIVAEESVTPVQQPGGYQFGDDPNAAVNPYTGEPIGPAGDYGGTSYSQGGESSVTYGGGTASAPSGSQLVSGTYRDYRRGRPSSLGPVGSALGTQRTGGMGSGGGGGGSGVASGTQPTTAQREYREFMRERSATLRPLGERRFMSGVKRFGGRGDRGRGDGGSVSERRRALARSGGPSTLRRHRMAGQLAGFEAVDPAAMAQKRHDPYRETFYEWGEDIAGTDKAGNVWSINDLGIQY